MRIPKDEQDKDGGRCTRSTDNRTSSTAQETPKKVCQSGNDNRDEVEPKKFVTPQSLSDGPTKHEQHEHVEDDMKDVRFDRSVGKPVRQESPDSPRLSNLKGKKRVRLEKHIRDPNDEVDRYQNGDDRILSQSGSVTTEHRFVASVLSILKAH